MATVSRSICTNSLPAIRKEINRKKTQFLGELSEKLDELGIGHQDIPTTINVTVFHHESRVKGQKDTRAKTNRRNFRRRLQA
jgi:hypothetical protein